MRVLFINQTFPGVFGPLLAAFAGGGEHECFFASGFQRQGFGVPGVRHIRLGGSEKRSEAPVREMESVRAAGLHALRAFERLNETGFEPDMVLFTRFCGYALFCGKAFPNSFKVCWTEDTDPLAGADTAGVLELFRLGLLCRQVMGADLVTCLTDGRQSALSARLKRCVDLPYPVGTDWFAPHKVESFPHEDLDLARCGELVVLRVDAALAEDPACQELLGSLLSLRPGLTLAVLCEGRSVAGALARSVSSLVARFPGRLHFLASMSLGRYRNLLALADLLVIPGCVPLPSSMLLEAMSSGLPVAMAPESALSPRLEDRGNVFCVPELAHLDNPAGNAAAIAAIVADRELLTRVGAGARRTVEEHFCGKRLIPEHARFLLDSCATWRAARG